MEISDVFGFIGLVLIVWAFCAFIGATFKDHNRDLARKIAEEMHKKEQSKNE